MTAVTADRLVIRRHVSGISYNVSVKARMLATMVSTSPGDHHNDLTPVGRAILDQLNMVDGLEIVFVLRHGVQAHTYDDALWTWDELVPQIAAAFNEATGLRHEVVRLDGA